MKMGQRVEERGRHKKYAVGESIPRQRRGVTKGKRMTARKNITLRNSASGMMTRRR